MMQSLPATRLLHKKMADNRRGLARLELLAALAALAAVLGLTLGLAVKTDRASREMLRHEAAVQYCQQAMAEAARLVRAAAAPAALASASASPGPRYGRKELALIVAENGGFSRVALDTADQGRSRSALRRRTLELGAAGATTRTAELSGVSRPERFEPRIRFAYAAPPEPGQAVNYLDEWTSATPPALVRITIQARVGDHTAHSGAFELQTAVIPGMIPAGTTVAAAAHPAAPAPEPAGGKARSATRRSGAAASSRLLESIGPAAKPAAKSAAKASAKSSAKTSAKSAAKPAAKRTAKKAAKPAASAKQGKTVKVISAKAPGKVVNRAKSGTLKERSGR